MFRCVFASTMLNEGPVAPAANGAMAPDDAAPCTIVTSGSLLVSVAVSPGCAPLPKFSSVAVHVVVPITVVNGTSTTSSFGACTTLGSASDPSGAALVSWNFTVSATVVPSATPGSTCTRKPAVAVGTGDGASDPNSTESTMAATCGKGETSSARTLAAVPPAFAIATFKRTVSPASMAPSPFPVVPDEPSSTTVALATRKCAGVAGPTVIV